MDGDAVMPVVDAEADAVIRRGGRETEAKDCWADLFPEFPLRRFDADIAKTPKLHGILQFDELTAVIGGP
jgi:hypothetical protein